jgi:hypothetical protein
MWNLVLKMKDRNVKQVLLGVDTSHRDTTKGMVKGGEYH